MTKQLKIPRAIIANFATKNHGVRDYFTANGSGREHAQELRELEEEQKAASLPVAPSKVTPMPAEEPVVEQPLEENGVACTMFQAALAHARECPHCQVAIAKFNQDFGLRIVDPDHVLVQN